MSLRPVLPRPRFPLDEIANRVWHQYHPCETHGPVPQSEVEVGVWRVAESGPTMYGFVINIHDHSSNERYLAYLVLGGPGPLGTIQCFKTVIISFNFRWVFYRCNGIVAQAGKDTHSLFHCHADWMASANIGRPSNAWLGHIYFILFHLFHDFLHLSANSCAVHPTRHRLRNHFQCFDCIVLDICYWWRRRPI